VFPKIGVNLKYSFPERSNLIINEFDYNKLEKELVNRAKRLVAENPDVGVVLLECSDMPPFAHAIQSAIKLPVFDFISMINWVYSGLVQNQHAGIL